MNRPNDISAVASEPPVRGLDALAMLLSGLCLIHCLALPLLVAALPLAASSLVADERFHQWLLLGAVPTSVIALGWGWRRHRDNLVAWLGVIGLILMVFAAFGIQAELIDAHGERVLTVIGAVMLAVAHLRNYQLRHHGHDHSQPHAPH
ncbi:MerC domain-containing protein [Nevskia ramosa]|uniref:MerC domain-containing protein n=1 Tax=Nevskia ramosa TaxID=64002 RepID=UPI003D0DC876